MAKKGERDPKRERFWRAALRRQQTSGLTAKEFCRREQLAETAYYYWRRELARRDQEPGARAEREKRVRAPAVPEAANKRPVVSPPSFRELAILGGPSSVDHGLEKGTFQLPSAGKDEVRLESRQGPDSPLAHRSLDIPCQVASPQSPTPILQAAPVYPR